MGAPIDSDWSNSVLSDGNLNKTTYGQGSSFPSTWRTDRLFWHTTKQAMYQNTGTESSPTWTSLANIGAPVMPHNTTIGDYTLPSATDSTGNTFTKVGDYEADFTSSSTATGWSTLGNNLPVDGDTHIDGGFATIDFTYNPDIYQNAQNTNIGDSWRHVLDFTDSNVLGRGLTSTWVARFRFRVNSAYMGSGGSHYLHVVADFIPTSESNNGEINYRKASNGSGGTRARQFTSFNSQYVEVIQTSSNRIFNGYTDSTYTTRAVVDPDPIQNSHTDSTGYTTGFQFKYKHTSGQKNYNGDVSDFKIWENTSSPAGNNFHIDNDTASRFVTPAMANPIIQADLTASTRCSHIAIHTHSDTTETVVQIQTSTDNANWTTQRTINVSNLTHGGYNYIRFNPVQARYVRVRGSSGASKVLAISNIKVLNGVADSALIETHGHLSISKTDGTLPVEG